MKDLLEIGQIELSMHKPFNCFFYLVECWDLLSREKQINAAIDIMLDFTEEIILIR